MDELRFTRHTVLIDLREIYKAVPSIYDFKPRLNPSATTAIIHDCILDMVLGGKTSNNINCTALQKHRDRAAYGRLRSLGYTSGVANAVVKRIREIIQRDNGGLLTTIFSQRHCPYLNLGWYVDGVCTRNPHIVKITFPRVIINGKIHSMEYYRDKYLPKVLKADIKKLTGFYGVGRIHDLKTSTLLKPKADILYEIVQRHEAATRCQ